MRKILAVLLVFGLFITCGGCLRKNTGARLVEKISVQWVEDGISVQRVHKDPEKLHLILNKLRTLGQRFSTDVDPETLDTSALTMTVVYSDGSERLYQVKPDRYVRIGQAPWQQADPKKVSSLRLLLLSLPGDLQT